MRLNKGGESNNKLSNRPSSTVLMQVGDKDTKKMIKKKFDLPNARKRDPSKPMNHSYKAKLNNPMISSQKWIDNAGSGQSKVQTSMAQKFP